MEPEEIDKLFKNRLSGLPATPSPDAWMRLQQKMEPPQKQRTMWVYYMAASLTAFLLVAGLFFFRNTGQTGNVQVAQTETKAPGKKNNFGIFSTRATTHPEKSSTSETVALNPITTDQSLTSEKKETLKKDSRQSVNKAQELLAVNKPRPVVKEPVQKPAIPAAKPNTDPAPTLAQSSKPAVPDQRVNNTFAQNNTTAASGQVVQVVVKLDNNEPAEGENSEEGNLRESLYRKGSLLKNIYLQARNLKNGEPVELAVLGVDTEKINNEKENIKQKINKVISH